jgi:Glycosyl hydrolase family 79 C-terminal beta domain
VAHLLSPGASGGLVRGMARYVNLAHRHGARFRVDELNAVTCGGQAGVSDTFAAALWTLDTQFWLARTGVDAVDVHIHPEAPANQLFTFRRQSGRWVGSVRPQYYGLLMFSQAAPPGARLLQVFGPGSGTLHSWATLGAGGRRIRVVLINDSLSTSTTVLVRAPGASGVPAALERLQAPSAHASGDVTLGGQSFGSQTTSGALRGRASVLQVASATGGYRVTVPEASAAMLTIAAR